MVGHSFNMVVWLLTVNIILFRWTIGKKIKNSYIILNKVQSSIYRKRNIYRTCNILEQYIKSLPVTLKKKFLLLLREVEEKFNR